MQETDDALPEVTFIDLGWYFGTGLAALSPRSNMGTQLEMLRFGLNGCRGSDRVDYSLSDEVIDLVSRMRPIERKLAAMSEENRHVMLCMFGDPRDRPRVEWTWLVKSTRGSAWFPLGLLLLAARTLGLGDSTLLLWSRATTASERTEAAAGMSRIKEEARRLRDGAVQEWRALGKSESPRAASAPSSPDRPKQAARPIGDVSKSVLRRLRKAPA